MGKAVVRTVARCYVYGKAGGKDGWKNGGTMARVRVRMVSIFGMCLA